MTQQLCVKIGADRVGMVEVRLRPDLHKTADAAAKTAIALALPELQAREWARAQAHNTAGRRLRRQDLSLMGFSYGSV